MSAHPPEDLQQNMMFVQNEICKLLLSSKFVSLSFLKITYITCTARSNPLLTWYCTSLNSIVWMPQENLNLRSPSSRYRYRYISGVRWAYSKMPVGAMVRAVTSMWVPVMLLSLWLRYDRPVKAATLIPICSWHSAPSQPNLHMHCKRERFSPFLFT